MEAESIGTRGAGDGHGWLRALGVGMIVLGGIAIFAAFAATLATVLIFGALLLVAGLAQLAHAFRSRSEDFAWESVAGGLYAAVGLLLIVDPVGGAVGLTLLLAVFFLVFGVLRLSLARRLRSRGRPAGLAAATGVLDLLLGGLIVVGWPGTAAWAIGLLVGVELLASGLALTFAAPAAAAPLTPAGDPRWKA